MKKIYLSLFVLMMTCVSLSAQVLYTDNFDTYTSGAKVATTIGAPFWSTWSSAPGGAEDGVFSTTQSVSPSNSIYISGTNDQIFNCGDKTTGRYELSWKMFVPTVNIGYFNILHNFNASNSEWGFQAYMYDDSIYVDADGGAAAGRQFSRNAWHSIKLVIDVDDDFATFFLDGTEVISYQWSKGCFGDGTTTKLDAINFYAWDGATPPTTINNGTTKGYYIDDLLFEQVTAPEAPSNLTAVLNGGDIDVNWTAPTATPSQYKLSRNGNVVFESPSAISYVDVAPWPNVYTYMARACYNTSGYSHSSNTATVTKPGGVTRNLVLFEGGTYITCTYCPGAAMGLRDLIEVNSKAATAIEYHNGDAYDNMEGVARTAYYAITGYPTVFADGALSVVGGNATTSMYPNYLSLYNERTTMPGFHTITANVVPTATPDNYTATITVNQNYAAWASGLKLHTSLTESNIAQAWGNQTELDYVCRGLFPDANGTDLDFSSSSTQTVTINFSAAGYVKNNCEFVIFVQHDASREITQVAAIDMASVVGVQEIQGEKISLYPNPASDYLMLMSNGKGTMSISDITGKVVYTSAISNTTEYADVRNFAKGVYLVKVTSDEKIFIQKLIIE